jgi:hypothetical protein
MTPLCASTLLIRFGDETSQFSLLLAAARKKNPAASKPDRELVKRGSPQN